MDIKDLNQITQYFVQYGKDEQLGHKFFHKENDNFKIIITPDKELYQLNTDHEPYGIELDTIDNLKIRFKSFTGENLEDVSRTYNQIIDEANTNYLRNCLDTKWMKEDFYFDGSPRHHLYLREEFINKCKTDPEFSEKWGLKIEEREILKQIDQTNPMLKGSTTLVPTKLITVTYNNETIESYE